MRRILLLVLVLSGIVCTPNGQPSSKNPADLVPASNEAAGWSRSGNLDTTSTSAGLTALIGAAAQTYADNDFAAFCRQSFNGTIIGVSEVIELRIADMRDTTHARSVFAAFAATGQVPWTGDNPGTEARVRQDSTGYAIDFRAGSFYVRLRIDSSTAPVIEAVRYFARVVGHKADSTAAVPVKPRDCVDLVPTGNEISGWSRSGNMAVCENQTQLFDLIDGEAQTYVDNGFVKSAFQDFGGTVSGNPVTLKLRVFDMGDTAHARGVFVAAATGSETPWTGDNPGAEARIDESLLFDYRIDYRSSKFYVSVDIADKSDAGLSIARLFSFNIDGAIKDTTH
jgi:hypothetical protein